MLLLYGAQALPNFRRRDLYNKAHKIAPSIVDIDVEYRYFVDTCATLNQTDINSLNNLFHCTNTYNHNGNDSFVVLVIPRRGTISPWSTKATEITMHCGLTSIKRVEKGIAYIFFTSSDLSDKQQQDIGHHLHDKMTEELLFQEHEATTLFDHPTPLPSTHIDLLSKGRNLLISTNKHLGLALTTDQIDYLLRYYTDKQENPTDAELMMFAQANSEHCRHNIFNANWVINNKKKHLSLFEMIRHTHSMNPQGVLSAYKDNSSVIEGFKSENLYSNPANNVYDYYTENLDILMKVETHNHPTAISPKPGAATGSGGEIRDEGATGVGAKPKAALTGFSVSHLFIPNYHQPWEISFGKPDRIASALDIMLEAPIGSSRYNNEFGRPTLCGYFRTLETLTPHKNNQYAKGYHKPIMLAGGMGNIRREHIQKKTITENTKLIILGGAAMEIGLGGGASSSITSGHNTEALDFSSVQRDNPEMGRRCQEVIDRCCQLKENNPISFIHDIGAGGVGNAIPELLNDTQQGGLIQLREIPCAEPGMSPLAIWSNESQERYALAVPPEKLETFIGICKRERCPYGVIGTTTKKQQLIVEDNRFKNTVINIPISFLLGDTPTLQKKITSPSQDISYEPLDTTAIILSEAITRVLRLPSVASKEFLITIGDRSVGGLTYRDQMVGPWQIPVADSAVTASSLVKNTGESMSIGEKAPIAITNAPASGRMAVGEALTNIAGNYIDNISNIKLSANWMADCNNPDETLALYNTVKAVGMELCPQLGLAIPVGKDSLSMCTQWNDKTTDTTLTVSSPLSLIVSAFAPVKNIKFSLTPQLQPIRDSNLILLDLGKKRNRLGASALSQVYNQIGGKVPDVDSPKTLRAFFDVVQQSIHNQWLLAYHDRSDGGLLVSLLEMAFAGQTGMTIDLASLISDHNALIPALFAEELGAIIQVSSQHINDFMTLISDHKLNDCTFIIGHPNTQSNIQILHQKDNLYEDTILNLQRIWQETSYHMQAIRDNPNCAQQAFDNLLTKNPGLSATVPFKIFDDTYLDNYKKSSRPSVAILREQGVNSHIEMAAAFHAAGFTPEDVHMSDILAGKCNLDQYLGLALCGGFSYGDVLGAGQGWAKNILFNRRARDLFLNFFHRNNTFTLGVCNGCQVLSYLKELIPYTEHWPTFTHNESEQFEARLVMVEVVKSSSIFLQDMESSQLPIVVSHGEGRASFNHLTESQSFIYEQMLALRYIDNNGHSTERYPYNPNGSPDGITGITSKDGRVLAMMPHPERCFKTLQYSWHPDDWKEFSPWMRMFQNARFWIN